MTMKNEDSANPIGVFVTKLRDTILYTPNSQYNMMSKVQRALDMFSSQKKILFVIKDDTHLSAVIQSQQNEEKEYITYLNSGGKFFCCTPEMEECLGLGRKICKHIMLSMIAAIKLNPNLLEELIKWTENSKKRNPHLIEEHATETYQRYRLALVGDVQWRPVELLPEDYVML